MDWEALKQEVRQGLRVRIDSREVEPGDLFIVLEENKRFVKDACINGARYFVVGPEHKDLIPQIEDVQIVSVLDPKRSLGDLAAAYYGTEKQNFILIGITGTNGKTTTSYFLEHLLTHVGLKVGVIGTVNYRWLDYVEDSVLTTPGCMKLHEIIAKMRSQGVDAIIMEVSSHGLAQDRVAGLKFDFAVFTNLTQDHLDYHRDMEDYFSAKAKLFYKYLRHKGTAIINLDDPYGQKLVNVLDKKIIGYTISSKNMEKSISAHILSSFRGMQKVRFSYETREWEIQTPFIGTHNVYNLLAAQGVGLAMGLKHEVFKCFEENFKIPGRMEKVENSKGLNVYIDYAHTPDALARALMAMKDMNFKRTIVVFGCGGNRDRDKRSKMGEAASKYSDVIVVTSDNPRFEDPKKIIEDILPGINSSKPLVVEVDRKRAIQKAIEIMEKDDALLIAGKGHETYQEIKGVRYPFRDKKVVLEILDSWN
ncbi:UDP-N-acetylmuramoyl-L-alanyl-D-glutamate--2,6-diaminopimelate ligase [Desulfothermus okinawensis JCM 13304]